jgi:hypothetical protein
MTATIVGREENVAGFETAFSFTQITATIEQLAGALSAALRNAKPDKARVEFSIEAALESGKLTALLIQGSGTGNLKVVLEWDKSQ